MQYTFNEQYKLRVCEFVEVHVCSCIYAHMHANIFLLRKNDDEITEMWRISQEFRTI